MPRPVQYAELSIRMFRREESGYPVEIALLDGPDFPRGFLDSAFLPWVSTASPEEDGERLYAWLMADQRLNAAWAEARGRSHGQRRIRLRIEPDAAELHGIPWELLREPGPGGLGIDLAAGMATPFSRYLPSRLPAIATPLAGPIRVLVSIADSAGLEAYNLQPVEADQEWQLLQEAAGGLEQVELVRLEGPCTLTALRAALAGGCHVWHFVGHGGFSSRRGAVLFLADEDNQVRATSEAEMGGFCANLLADVAGARPAVSSARCVGGRL